MSWEPRTGELWAVVNERDELGSDLVPDYLTSVKDGAFYGWPFSYYGQHVDTRVEPQNPGMVTKAIVPDYALGNHVAPLGLTFARGSLLPEPYRAALSSVSTAPGTAIRAAGTKSSLCRSSTGAGREPAGCSHRLCQRGGRRARPPGRGCNRQVGGVAGRRRCRQCRLAGRPGRAIGRDQEVRQEIELVLVLSAAFARVFLIIQPLLKFSGDPFVRLRLALEAGDLLITAIGPSRGNPPIISVGVTYLQRRRGVSSWLRPPLQCGLAPEQQQQIDDRYRHAHKPKQCTFSKSHCRLLALNTG